MIVALLFSSCSDFLERAPEDAFSTSTFPKSEKDVQMLAVGCYNDWTNPAWIIEGDAMTDNMYDGFPWEGWSVIQDGTMSSSDAGAAEGLYKDCYAVINRCNNFLSVTEPVEFANANDKDKLTAEVRFLRAWNYFQLTMGWGDVPLAKDPFATVEEAQLAQTAAGEVVKFIDQELNDIIDILDVEVDKGRISRGAALALKMRLNLFVGNNEEALSASRDIEELGAYELFNKGELPYSDLFLQENEGNLETILAYQYLDEKYSGWVVNLLPNGDGGWSSVVPVQGLVDDYETINGLTINEDVDYDPIHPYLNRDPRLKATVLYSGRTWSNTAGQSRVYNAIDKELNGSANPDYRYNKGNSTKSGYNFIKWTPDLTKFSDVWSTGFDVYVFRFAEVLLSKAEAMIELNQINNEMYDAIDMVRSRAGMPAVDRAKYADQNSLRQLIRRERRIEFAGEGMRRWDIIRWDTAKDVLNGDIQACVGTVSDLTNSVEELRVTMGAPERITTNKFDVKNKLFPFPQTYRDMNPKLEQNTGY